MNFKGHPGKYSLMLWLNIFIFIVDTFLCSSVQFSSSVVSNSFRPHEPQHAGPPCPSPTPRVYSNSCPLSWWCHLTISSSVITFSSHPQSFPEQGLFQWVSSSHQVAKVLEFQLNVDCPLFSSLRMSKSRDIGKHGGKRQQGKLNVKWSHSVVSDSLQPHGLYSPWNSPGQNTGVGSLSFSRESSPPRGQIQVLWIKPRSPALQADSLPAEPPVEPHSKLVLSLQLHLSQLLTISQVLFFFFCLILNRHILSLRNNRS